MLAAHLLAFLLNLFYSFGPISSNIQTATIHLSIENIQRVKGSVRIAIYEGENDFLKDDQAVVTKVVLVEKLEPLTVKFPNLPFGSTYTIAIYHDENDNNKLDTNFMGVPKEPYGFSNNAPSKWGPPKYEEAVFTLNESDKYMVITVKKWSKQ
ncbi:MAG: DUF2141 domain-containing protein [Bacteroidota bacterium]